MMLIVVSLLATRYVVLQYIHMLTISMLLNDLDHLESSPLSMSDIVLWQYKYK